MSNFTWFVGSTDIKDAFHQVRILGWLHAFFGTSRRSRIRVGFSGKRSTPKRLAPDSLIYPAPTTLPLGFFSWVMFFLSRCHGQLYARGGVLILLS